MGGCHFMFCSAELASRDCCRLEGTGEMKCSDWLIRGDGMLPNLGISAMEALRRRSSPLASLLAGIVEAALGWIGGPGRFQCQLAPTAGPTGARGVGPVGIRAAFGPVGALNPSWFDAGLKGAVARGPRGTAIAGAAGGLRNEGPLGTFGGSGGSGLMKELPGTAIDICRGCVGGDLSKDGSRGASTYAGLCGSTGAALGGGDGMRIDLTASLGRRVGCTGASYLGFAGVSGSDSLMAFGAVGGTNG